MKVEIDGVVYAPVATVSLDAANLRRALVEQWWGSGSDEELDSYARDSGLRVLVSDNLAGDDGESLDEFVARVLARGNASHGD